MTRCPDGPARAALPFLAIIVLAVAVGTALDGKLERLEAALLVAALIAYTAFLFFQGRKSAPALAGPSAPARTQTDQPAWKNLVLVVAGLALLVIGASWLVGSAVEITSAVHFLWRNGPPAAGFARTRLGIFLSAYFLAGIKAVTGYYRLQVIDF